LKPAISVKSQASEYLSWLQWLTFWLLRSPTVGPDLSQFSGSADTPHRGGGSGLTLTAAPDGPRLGPTWQADIQPPDGLRF